MQLQLLPLCEMTIHRLKLALCFAAHPGENRSFVSFAAFGRCLHGEKLTVTLTLHNNTTKRSTNCTSETSKHRPPPPTPPPLEGALWPRSHSAQLVIYGGVKRYKPKLDGPEDPIIHAYHVINEAADTTGRGQKGECKAVSIKLRDPSVRVNFGCFDH